MDVQNNSKYKLWESLQQKKLYTKSFDDFNNQFSNDVSINKLHQSLFDKKLYTKGESDFISQFFSDSIKPIQKETPKEPKVQEPKPQKGFELDKSLFEVKGRPTSEAVVGGPMETVKIAQQKQEKRQNIAKAIDKQIAIREKSFGSKFTPQQINNYKSIYQNGLNNGSIVLTRDNKGELILGQADRSIFSSFMNTYNDLFKKSNEDVRFQGLSKADKIKAHEAEAYAQEDLPTVPMGFGKVGQIIAETVQPLANPIISSYAAATAALTGAGEVEAAKQFGNAVGFVKDMMYGSYKQNWDKVYKGNLEGIEAPTEEQKMAAADKADNAALVAAGVGGATGAAFSIPLGKLSNEVSNAAGNYIEALGNVAKHTGEEAKKLFGITAISDLIKGESSAAFGSKESQGDIVADAALGGAQTALLAPAMGVISAVPHAIGLLADITSSPSKAVDNAAKALVSTLPKGDVENIYKEGEAQGIFPQGTAQKVTEKLRKFEEAKNQVPKNVADENRKIALAGKIEKITNLQKELSETKIEARKADIQAELDKTMREADAIYAGDDPMLHEQDSLGNPLKEKTQPEVKVEEVTITPEQKDLNIQEATPDIRQEEFQKIKQEYDTRTSEGGVGETAERPSGEVSSKPATEVEFLKGEEPTAISEFDNWRRERYKSDAEFNAEYEREHLRDYGETKEEYIRRKYCE